MAHGVWAECPQCGKVAMSSDEIEEKFGYRYDGTKPQAWCKECRARERKEANCGYTDCPWHGESNCSTRFDCPCNDD